MTRKEKKEELIGLFCNGTISIGDLIDECFEFGQQHPNWISIKDEMPPRDEHYPSDSEPVLVYNPTQKYKVYIDWYIYDRCEDDDYIGWYSGNDGVTHWMLLPPEHFADVSKMMPKGGEQ